MSVASCDWTPVSKSHRSVEDWAPEGPGWLWGSSLMSLSTSAEPMAGTLLAGCASLGRGDRSYRLSRPSDQCSITIGSTCVGMVVLCSVLHAGVASRGAISASAESGG